MPQFSGTFDERSVRVPAQWECREVEPRIGRAVRSDRTSESEALEGMRDLDVNHVRRVELAARRNAFVECWIDPHEG